MKCLAFCLPLAITQAVSAAPALIESIYIQPPEEASTVLSIIPLHVNEKYDPKLLEATKKMLLATDRFANIEVKWDERNRNFYIVAEPKHYFEDYEWTGESIDFTGELEKNCMQTNELRDISQERLSQISRCLLQDMQGRGYLDAEVVLEPKGDTLHIEAKLGEIYRIDKVEFTGADHVPSDRIMMDISNRPEKYFRPLKLEEDTKAILKIFLDRGYYFAEVFRPTVDLHTETKTVNLNWRVHENIKMIIEFKGDYTDRDFLNEQLNREENLPRWFLDELVDDVRNKMRNQGFLNVRVDVTKELSGEAVERVTIRTQSGPRFRLKEPDLIGVSDRNEVEKIINSIESLAPGNPFQEDAFRKALKDELSQAMLMKGYVDFQIRSVDFVIDNQTHEVKPVIYMNEGERFLIEESSIEGLPSDFSKSDEANDLRKAIRLGNAFNSTRTDELQRALNRALINAGYLDAKVDRKTARTRTGVTCKMLIDSGPRYRISRILVKGARKTKYAVLRREILLEEGEYYEDEQIRDAISHILRLSIARNVDIQPLEKDPVKGEVVVLVDVSEAPRFRFDIGPGYGTVDGLRVTFRGTYANIGGYGRRLNLFVKANRRFDGTSPNPSEVYNFEQLPFIQRRITLEYFEPSLFGKRLDGRLQYTHLKQNLVRFGLLSNKVTASVDYRLSRRWIFTTHYDIDFSDPFNVRIGLNTTDRDKERKRLTSLGETLVVDYRDDAFSPTKGFKTTIDLDLYDKWLGGQESFWQQQTKQDFIFPVWTFKKGKVLGYSLSLSAGFSGPFRETEEVSVEKRFAVGGETSVRGFDEKSISPKDRDGGDSFAGFMSELYIPAFWTIDLLGFLDGGNSYKSNKSWKPWDLRFGAGPGIRWNTPVGPLKFGYGFVLNRRCNTTTVAPGGSCPDGKYDPMGNFYFGVGPI